VLCMDGAAGGRGGGIRGAQAAFGTGPKSQDRTVHRTVPKIFKYQSKYGKNRRTVPSRPNRTANRLLYLHIPGYIGQHASGMEAVQHIGPLLAL